MRWVAARCRRRCGCATSRRSGGWCWRRRRWMSCRRGCLASAWQGSGAEVFRRKGRWHRLGVIKISIVYISWDMVAPRAPATLTTETSKTPACPHIRQTRRSRPSARYTPDPCTLLLRTPSTKRPRRAATARSPPRTHYSSSPGSPRKSPTQTSPSPPSAKFRTRCPPRLPRAPRQCSTPPPLLLRSPPRETPRRPPPALRRRLRARQGAGRGRQSFGRRRRGRRPSIGRRG
mmetsp:Transcript_22237/g.59133  ORF Transcript_22237/g.59133 Transcript_22237/m.59133 type:complete len:232 (+) Transcript_22237:310-1005(+)